MTVTISLSSEMVEFVEKKVASGEFSSPDEVLAAALMLLQEQDLSNALSAETLKRSWREGVESGDFRPLDITALKAEARRLHHSKI